MFRKNDQHVHLSMDMIGSAATNNVWYTSFGRLGLTHPRVFSGES